MIQAQSRISDQPEVIQKHIEWVAKETRLWSYERTRISNALDFIDDKMIETSTGVQSLWLQLVILVYDSINSEDPIIQRECILCVGEIRQAVRQVMAHDPMVGVGGDDPIFKDQFSELLDHILDDLLPDPSSLS